MIRQIYLFVFVANQNKVNLNCRHERIIQALNKETEFYRRSTLRAHVVFVRREILKQKEIKK